MAIDSRIALGVKGPDWASSIARGLATGEKLATSGIRKKLLEQQEATGEFTLEQARQQQAMQGLVNYGKVVDGLASIPDMAQRAKILAQQVPMLEEAGIPTAHLTSMDLSDAGLRNVQAGMKPFLAKAQAQAPAAVQSFDYFQKVIQSPNTTPEQKQAARIELKLDSPAPTNYQKSMLDMKKESTELKRLQVKEASESNELKKQKLQGDIAAQEAKMQQNSQAILDSAARDLSTLDNTLSTVTALAGHDGLKAAVGGTSFFPTMPGSSAADFEAKLEQLKGQQFLSEVQKMKGMGALSENEGKKLGAAAASLELNMSEDAFIKELEFIQETMTKARNKIAGKLPAQQEQQAAPAGDMSDDDLMKSLGL